MSLLQFNKLFLINSFRLVLTVSLAKHLNFKCLLVSVLAHHTLEFESVSVQLHIILLSFNNIKFRLGQIHFYLICLISDKKSFIIETDSLS